MAAVGVPIELALLSLIVAAYALMDIAYCDGRLTYWCCAAVGILLSPIGIGIPFFGFAFAALMLPIIGAAYKSIVR